MEVDDLLTAAAEEGDYDALQRSLATVTDPLVHINRLYDGPDSQKRTLLTIACLNRQEHFMKELLRDYTPDLEVLNVVRWDGNSDNCVLYYDVSVLWVAAAVDHLGIVKLLVEHGADVNHTTKTNSTALRCACCIGNMEMLLYLIEKGGDVYIAKEHNDTNLSASIHSKRCDLVAYLVLELRFGVNECDPKGRSCLYDAVYCDSLPITQFLLEQGARNFPSTYDGMSPLMCAAEKRRTDIFNVISPYCSILEQIEGEELFGSALVCGNQESRDLDQAFEHFSRAFHLRALHHLPRALRSSTLEVFDHRQECQTIDQLQEIRADPGNMWIEGILVRERLLGPANEEYSYSIRYQGAAFADRDEWHRTIALWLYELDLCRQHGIVVDVDKLRSFVSVFSDMLSSALLPPVEALQTVISETLAQLETDFDAHLHTLLFLITVISQVVVSLLFHLIYSIRSDSHKRRRTEC